MFLSWRLPYRNSRVTGRMFLRPLRLASVALAFVLLDARTTAAHQDPPPLSQPPPITAPPLPRPGDPGPQGGSAGAQGKAGDSTSSGGSSRGSGNSGSQGKPDPRQPDPSFKKYLEPLSKPAQDTIPHLTRRFAQHDPQRRVLFVLSLEEQGQAGTDCSWSSKGTGRFALLPTWDGARGVDPGLGLSSEMKAKLGMKPAATAEDLFDLRGGFLGLKVGERLQFYRKESQSQARGDCGEKGNWVESVQDGVIVRTEDGHTTTTREATADNADAWMVRTETGARLTYSWWIGEGIWGVSANNSGWPTLESRKVLTFVLTNEDLRRWETLNRTLSGPIQYKEDPGVSGTVKATLTTKKVEDEIEVSVEPETGYDQWTPEGNLDQPTKPGNNLTVYFYVRKKGDPGKQRSAKLEFTFKKVSMQPGVCINWPKEGAGPDYDLKILPEENEQLEVLGPDQARTRDLVSKAVLKISCYDFGAYGTLGVTGKDADGKEVKVKVQGKETSELRVPFDENGNHIADAWEKKYGVQGYPDNWDRAEVPGHMNSGDGLGLFEKYRGVVVLENGQRKWLRLPPKEKALFIVDPTNLVLPEAWKKASGIQIYPLSDEMAKEGKSPEASRIVNHRQSDPSNGFKYAVVMTRKATNDIETLLNKGGHVDMGYTDTGNTPKDIGFCIVYPDHIRAWILMYRNKLKKAIDTYGNKDPGYFQATYPKWLLERAYARLQDPAVVESLYQQALRATAIHELGHACGLAGHFQDGGEQAIGDRNCFMRYTSEKEDKDFTALEPLFKADAPLPTFSGIFCKAGGEGGFNCFGHLNVKDN